MDDNVLKKLGYSNNQVEASEAMKKIVDKNLNNSRIESMESLKLYKNYNAMYHLRTKWMFFYKLLESGVDVFSGKGMKINHYLNLTNMCYREDVKMFTIDEKLWTTFEETKNKIYYRKLPFQYNFIDKIVEVEDDIVCHGLSMIDGINKESKEVMEIQLHGYDFKDKSEWNMIFGIDKNNNIYRGNLEIDGFFRNTNMRDFQEKMLLIVCNFLDFLNHPELEIKEVPWYNNKKRMDKGKFAVQDNMNINIKGKLKRYIYDEHETNGNKIDCSFWVRSYYFHFRDKNHYKNIYNLGQDELQRKGYQSNQEGLISRFRPRFLKGSGKVKNKSYNLK